MRNPPFINPFVGGTRPPFAALRGGGGTPPVITRVTAPEWGPYTEGDTPEDAYTPGVYASSASENAPSVTAVWLVNGEPEAGDYILSPGDSVVLREDVADDIDPPNERTFSYAPQTVAYGTLAASGAVPTQSWTLDEAITPLDMSDYFAGGTVTAYAVQAVPLPDGISLNTSTGEITGTPTEEYAEAEITIRASNPAGHADQAFDVSVLTTPALFSFTIYNEAGSSTISAVPALRVRINGGSWQTLSAASLTISQPSAGVLEVAGFAGTESSVEWAFEHEYPGEVFWQEGTVSGVYVRGGAAPENTALPGLPLAATIFETPVEAVA